MTIDLGGWGGLSAPMPTATKPRNASPPSRKVVGLNPPSSPAKQMKTPMPSTRIGSDGFSESSPSSRARHFEGAVGLLAKVAGAAIRNRLLKWPARAGAGRPLRPPPPGTGPPPADRERGGGSA